MKLLVVLSLMIGVLNIPSGVAAQTVIPKQLTLSKPAIVPKLSPQSDPIKKQIPNPQPISSITASIKIVGLGYALLEGYIKNLTSQTNQYTNGTFDFNLDNGTNVHIAPASINGKTWQSITFRFKDNTVKAIILDGPITGTPGTPNQQAMADAKNALKEELDKSQMVASSVNKDPSKVIKFQLSSEYDFQNLLNLMKSSIDSGLLSTEQPQTIIINPDPTKCFPTPCKTITLKKDGPATTITEGDVKVTTTLPLKVEDNKVSVERNGQAETIILPGEAKKVVETISLQKGVLPTKIFKIGLARCEPKVGPEPPCGGSTAVYQIGTEKEAKLLGIVPVKSNIDYQIDATNGKIVGETKPWYLQITSFLRINALLFYL